MAKSSSTATDTDRLCKSTIEDIRKGVFKPVYLLMGAEPFYPEKVCSAIIEHCIPEEDKDFNETVCYGADVSAEQIVSAARRFPMMAERQLVVVKEAQMVKDLEQVAVYCKAPLESTVLVLLLHGASVDKRMSLYKSVSSCGGLVIDSPAVRDYSMVGWIVSYYAGRGLSIDPKAATLLFEAVGCDLCEVEAQTDKLLRNLPEGTTRVSVGDIEKNVGLSRQFSIFELTRELSFRNADKALRIASHIGNSAKFNMPTAVGALYLHFSRILKYAALKAGGRPVSPEDKATALSGVNPYFYKEYDTAVSNYPLPKAMKVISLLCEFDYKGKGGDGGGTETPGELIVELCSRILST